MQRCCWVLITSSVKKWLDINLWTWKGWKPRNNLREKDNSTLWSKSQSLTKTLLESSDHCNEFESLAEWLCIANSDLTNIRLVSFFSYSFIKAWKLQSFCLLSNSNESILSFSWRYLFSEIMIAQLSTYGLWSNIGLWLVKLAANEPDYFATPIYFSSKSLTFWSQN